MKALLNGTYGAALALWGYQILNWEQTAAGGATGFKNIRSYRDYSIVYSDIFIGAYNFPYP
jgi:hypothetical protein